MKDTGGSAYPATQGANKIWNNNGMTLRDYFAGKALNGLLSDSDYEPDNYNESITEFSYKLADAMIKERNKE